MAISRNSINLFVVGLILALGLALAAHKRRMPTDLGVEIVVQGLVVDGAGQPISGAVVQARLGLDGQGVPTESGPDGRFRATAAAPRWFKASPNVVVSHPGRPDTVQILFDVWDRGSRTFNRRVVLP